MQLLFLGDQGHSDEVGCSVYVSADLLDLELRKFNLGFSTMNLTFVGQFVD